MLPANVKSVEMCHFFNMLFATREDKMRSTIINANRINVHMQNLHKRIYELQQMQKNGDMRPEITSELGLCQEHMKMFQKYKSDTKILKKHLRLMQTVQPKMQTTIKNAKTAEKQSKIHTLEYKRNNLMGQIDNILNSGDTNSNKCKKMRRILPWIQNIDVLLRKHSR